MIARSARDDELRVGGPTIAEIPPGAVERFGAAVAGALALHFALMIWGYGKIRAYPEILAMDLALYALAFGLFWLALVSASRWRHWTSPLVLVAASLTTIIGVYVWTHSILQVYGTDVILFERYAAELVLRGVDPYSVSMLPALQQFHLPLFWRTLTWDGGLVDRLSYPAGSFLIFAPFVAIGVTDLRWVVLLFHLAAIGVLYAAAPRHLRLLVLLPMLGSTELVDFTGSGVVDFPWVLPLLLMIVWQRRPIVAGICYGVACAIKQDPWFLGPFLLVYYFRHEEDAIIHRRLVTLASFALAAAGLFLAFNLPFIVHDPHRWVSGTLAPVLGNLMPLGQGPSTLTQLGFPLPADAFTLAAAAIAILLIVNYAVYFDRLRDVVWVFPMIITWFMPRSLHNYFIFWIPVAALALARRVNPDLPQPPQRDASQPGPHRFRVAELSVSLIALLLIVLVGSAYARTPRLPFSVDVVSMDDPSHIGVVTRMTLRVINHGATEAAPVFTVLASFPFPARWSGVSGPPRLAAAATGEYQIESPAAAAIPVGDDFVVRVNDAYAHVFSASPPMRATLRHPLPLLNPEFAVWLRDPATDQARPLGWDIVGLRSPIGPDLRVVQAVVAGRPALVFRIADHAGPGTWRGIRCDQFIEDPAQITRLLAGFSVTAYPTFRYTRGYSPATGTPGNVLGIQIRSGARVLWIVFSDTDAGWYVQPDAAVLVLHAPLGRWSAHRIDLGAAYRKLGWPRPDDMVLSLLAARSGAGSGAPAPAFGGITLGF